MAAAACCARGRTLARKLLLAVVLPVLGKRQAEQVCTDRARARAGTHAFSTNFNVIAFPSCLHSMRLSKLDRLNSSRLESVTRLSLPRRDDDNDEDDGGGDSDGSRLPLPRPAGVRTTEMSAATSRAELRASASRRFCNSKSSLRAAGRRASERKTRIGGCAFL